METASESILGILSNQMNTILLKIFDFYLEISGKTYCGSAFYIHSIPGIMARQGKFEHPAYGRYFWASNFILLQEPTVACLVEAIEHMISDGSHELAFLEVQPDDSEEPKAT